MNFVKKKQEKWRDCHTLEETEDIQQLNAMWDSEKEKKKDISGKKSVKIRLDQPKVCK